MSSHSPSIYSRMEQFWACDSHYQKEAGQRLEMPSVSVGDSNVRRLLTSMRIKEEFQAIEIEQYLSIDKISKQNMIRFWTEIINKSF